MDTENTVAKKETTKKRDTKRTYFCDLILLSEIT